MAAETNIAVATGGSWADEPGFLARLWSRVHLGRAFIAVLDAIGKLVPFNVARPVTALGAVVALVSTFMSWTWTTAFPGDLTVSGYPGGNQVITIGASIVLIVLVGAAYGVPGLRALAPKGASRGLRLAAVGLLAATWYTLFEIASELGGVANFNTGAWVAGIGTLVALLGACAVPPDEREAPPPKELPGWAEIGLICVVLALALLIVDYGITTGFTELFIGFIIAVAFGASALAACGALGRVTELTAKFRTVTLIGAFVAAAAFPFTQSSDQYTNIAANVLIFGTVALGLNIVVGLAGLLDLGYVAFLGVGAYSAALVSGSIYSRFRHSPQPFWVAVLIGVAAAIVAGMVIGAPTLRLRGDYLAIVTVGFGQIFFYAVNNMDGISGPSLTNGPNGIPSIPELKFFGYNLGEPHNVLGVTFGKFANYYMLLLVIVAFVVFVFIRVNDSRIGRAWIAIREDETAAVAMGINGFRFKLLAFGLGASLAGLAGTVQAHVQTTVTPDQYVFAGSAPPNSAFLVAAVVLGGMGTISGPLLGAALLYLIPAKLQFFQDKQLWLFGLALIVMIRFRPEGLVVNRRRRLEFHEEEVSEQEAVTVVAAEAGA